MKLKHILFILFAFITSTLSWAESHPPKVLLVVSSYGENKGEDKPGYEFDELAKAYLTFRDNGVDLDIASPKGGSVEADKYDPKKSYNQQFSEDASAMEKLSNTLAMDTIDSADYAGIFVIGGKGSMFDFPNNPNLQKFIASIYQAGGVVGAVCHGPAALVNVKLDNGKYLIKGKKINGFTNQEERVFGKKWVKHFDFLLEDKFKQRGALFESSPMMLSHVAVDGRLITGQNPSSTTDSVKAMLSTMGITPKENSNLYSDDESLKLVAQFLEGDNSVLDNYKENKGHYETPMIGVYGYYLLMHSESDQQVMQSLTLMKLAQQDMKNPRLALFIAKAHQKLGQISDAKAVLRELIAKHPELTEAKEMLKAL